MVLSNFIQGAHQSEPEKTNIIGLFWAMASVAAWLKSVFQFLEYPTTAINNSKNAILFFIQFYFKFYKELFITNLVLKYSTNTTQMVATCSGKTNCS